MNPIVVGWFFFAFLIEVDEISKKRDYCPIFSNNVRIKSEFVFK